MRKVYTPATIAEIVQRASNGADARTIANELDLKLTSLRVKCSQLGISLRKCRASRATALEQSNDAFADPSIDTTVPPMNSVPRVSYAGPYPNRSHLSNGSLTNAPDRQFATMNNITQMRPTPGQTGPAVAVTSSLSFKTDCADVPLVVVLPRQTVLRLRQCGAAKGMTAEGLAAQLLDVIAAEELYKAILDDGAA